MGPQVNAAVSDTVPVFECGRSTIESGSHDPCGEQVGHVPAFVFRGISFQLVWLSSDHKLEADATVAIETRRGERQLE